HGRGQGMGGGGNVGGEGGAHARAAECLGKRFGGKQVSAGSAGGEENKRHATWSVSAVDQAAPSAGANAPSVASNSARGRSRVKASSIPMPQAGENIHEP